MCLCGSFPFSSESRYCCIARPPKLCILSESSIQPHLKKFCDPVSTSSQSAQFIQKYVLCQAVSSLASTTLCECSSKLLDSLQPTRSRPRSVILSKRFRITTQTTPPTGMITMPTMVDRGDLNTQRRCIDAHLQKAEMAPRPTPAHCTRPPSPCTNSCRRSEGM